MYKTICATLIAITLSMMLSVISIALREHSHLRRLIGLVLLSIYILCNLYITLLSRDVRDVSISITPFHSYLRCFTIDQSGIRITRWWLVWQILLNYVLYIPLGCILPFLWKAEERVCIHSTVFFRTLSIGFALSMMVELMQVILSVGFFEFDDIFGNTSGTIIGYLVYCLFFNIFDTMLARQEIPNRS